MNTDELGHTKTVGHDRSQQYGHSGTKGHQPARSLFKRYHRHKCHVCRQFKILS